MGGFRYLRMIAGQLLRGSPHPAPVGRPDFYKRELHPPLFVRSSARLPVRDLVDLRTPDASPADLGAQCQQETGVFPLNFSFPQPQLMPSTLEPRPHFLSTTYPGEPFSFSSWEPYLEEYRNSYFALSTKKGGWDTFRHLEILFSGAIALMPGLDLSHRWSLALFPRRALIEVYRALREDGAAVPSDETRRYFRDWASERLTSRAVGEYLVGSAGLESRSLLFLDEWLPRRTDYLSAFVFVGLSQIPGVECASAWEPAYLFDDFEGDTSTLYGRGFGYTRTIPRRNRTGGQLGPQASLSELVDLCGSYDSIVVGNYDSNRERLGQLLRAGVPPEKFVCIVGSDLPPDFRLRREMAKSSMTFFVREFA